MNTANNVTTGKEATEKLMAGVSLAVQAIRPTYGPKGLNAVIEHDLYPYRVIANDAQTIIQAIHTEDPIEKQGLGFVKELMDRQNSLSGDGRKTTAILAEEILKAGHESALSGMELKRELDALIPLIEQKIDEQKQSITEEDFEKVATIAGESSEIGKTIGEIYKTIGRDGIIHVEGSGTFSTSTAYINGVRFIDTGFLSPYFVHDELASKENRTQTRAVYENPTILVTKRKISHINDIDPLLQKLSGMGKKDLVIFTDDMDSGVASTLVRAHQSKVFNILIIKAPVLWKQYVFEDFAKVTGSTIVEDATGVNFKTLELGHLGTCGKIVVDKDETVITGIADITDHLQALKADGSNDSKLRLSWLTTKTAILKLGANSESELSYKRLKCEDAINASRLALMDGVVIGGGVTLFSIANKDLLDFKSEAAKVLSLALQVPMKQLMDNANLTYETYLPMSGKVLDAAMVIKQAVRNAIGLASIVLTTGLVVTFPKRDENKGEINGKVLNF